MKTINIPNQNWLLAFTNTRISWQVRSPQRLLVSLPVEMLTELFFRVEFQLTKLAMSGFVKGRLSTFRDRWIKSGICRGKEFLVQWVRFGGGFGYPDADNVFQSDSIKSSQQLRGHNQGKPPWNELEAGEMWGVQTNDKTYNLVRNKSDRILRRESWSNASAKRQKYMETGSHWERRWFGGNVKRAKLLLTLSMITFDASDFF